VSHLAVAKVAKTFGIAGPPKLLASFAATVIPWPFLTSSPIRYTRIGRAEGEAMLDLLSHRESDDQGRRCS